MTTDHARQRSPWITTAWLAGTAAVASGIVMLASQATRERVARNEAAQVMKVLDTLLPPGSYDNRPDQDRIFIRPPGTPAAGDEPLPLYRARKQGQPVAAVMTVVAPQGYVGPIRLLVSLGVDERVIAVRAVAHRETPGLGDAIDATKSAWIETFAGRSLADPDTARWAVRHDGGDFDQLTGATITSRAVVNAVRDAALYFRQHREEIFARPAE